MSFYLFKYNTVSQYSPCNGPCPYLRYYSLLYPKPHSQYSMLVRSTIGPRPEDCKPRIIKKKKCPHLGTKPNGSAMVHKDIVMLELLVSKRVTIHLSDVEHKVGGM